MKRIILSIISVGAILSSASSCQQARDTRPASEIVAEAYQAAADSFAAHPDARRSEIYSAMLTDAYQTHKDDSAGVTLFYDLLNNYWSKETTLSEYETASKLVKSDELVLAKIQALRNSDAAATGNHFIDIEGTNILTGEPLSIASMLGDKPLLIDFWASWCGPCRSAIRSHLLDLAKTGKVDILGIAVWEKSEEDTKSAMEELGITWPVIYTGGRPGSPSIKYGVMSIPSMFLIAPDGTIIGSKISAAKVEGLL